MSDFEADRAALLVMDFQNYGLHPEGYWAKQGLPTWPSLAYRAIEPTARVLAAARRNKRPLVIHVASAWREGSPEMNWRMPVFARGPDRAVEGTWDADFYEPLKPIEGEIVVTKRSISALAGTELDRLLRVRDIATLVLAAIATNFVVEGTAREAVDRGYRVIVLEDCCASATQEMHDFSVRVILPEICSVGSADEFIRWIED